MMNKRRSIYRHRPSFIVAVEELRSRRAVIDTSLQARAGARRFTNNQLFGTGSTSSSLAPMNADSVLTVRG
jgi:hypothetical protein